MPDYNCNSCNYLTIYKPNYLRHLKSRKHLIKKGELEVSLISESVLTKNEHKMNKNEQEKILKKIRKSKETIYKEFDENDINYYKTDANFILMESTKSQEDIVKECETNNINIEHENAFYDNYWSLPLSTEVINKRIVDIITSKF